VDLALLVAALGLVFAGLVKGSVGFGLPMIAVPVLTGFVGPKTAVVVMSIVNLASAVVVAARGGSVALRSYCRMLLPICGALVVGVVIGAHLLALLSPILLSAFVGLTSIAFAVMSAARLSPSVPPGRQPLVGSLIGLASGLMAGTTSIFASLVAIYFHALALPKRDFLVLLNIVLALGGIVQLASYAQLGLYDGAVLETAGLTAICVAVGVVLGFVVQDRVDQRIFNRVVLGVIFLVGLSLVARAFGV
jgi:uncharacterized membrane protein YfcA